MSEHEWFPPADRQTDFATSTEGEIDWSGHEQDAPEYVHQDQLMVEWGSGEYIPMQVTDADEYDGPYVARALFQSQSFDTAQKLMRDNFAVRAINYTEAPNESGVTVTIGG